MVIWGNPTVLTHLRAYSIIIPMTENKPSPPGADVQRLKQIAGRGMEHIFLTLALPFFGPEVFFTAMADSIRENGVKGLGQGVISFARRYYGNEELVETETDAEANRRYIDSLKEAFDVPSTQRRKVHVPGDDMIGSTDGWGRGTGGDMLG